MSVALGNTFTAAVSAFIENDDGTLILSGADYFYFYAKLMFANSHFILIHCKILQAKNLSA